MINNFESIDLGSPLGCFMNIAIDAIKLATLHKCTVSWEFNGTKLEVSSESVPEELWKIHQKVLYK